MSLLVLSVIAVPLALAVFVLYDRWVYRDDAPPEPAEPAAGSRLTHLNLSGR